MEELAQFFKALGDETRLRIILLLTESELCVCDLMFLLNVPQSKVSRHLAYLKHSGITESRRVGVWMHYRLKNWQDGLLKAQIDFLKRKISDMPVFRADREKLAKLKEQGECKALTKLRRARWSEAVTEQRRDGSTS